MSGQQVGRQSGAGVFFGVVVAIVMVIWVISGAITGKWTDDDWNNRDCFTIENDFTADEEICRDRDTGEFVPPN